MPTDDRRWRGPVFLAWDLLGKCAVFYVAPSCAKAQNRDPTFERFPWKISRRMRLWTFARGSAPDVATDAVDAERSNQDKAIASLVTADRSCLDWCVPFAFAFKARLIHSSALQFRKYG